MRILFIRHAIAADRAGADTGDAERPLTPQGARRFRRTARGLTRLVRRPDAILTSPLLRARQTAEIAADAWGRVKPMPLQALASGEWGGIGKALASMSGDSTVALVGHEPSLSRLLARLLGSRDAERFAFRKGGAALVDLPAGLDEGASLVWFLPPRALRGLR
jgi:phosphohistidine phosphatase